MADERLRKISFTGSTGVGATLLEQAAPGIINTSMELGGDGPFIVLDDADVELAAQQAVVCKFRNAGQACVAANRIIVHSAVAAEFTARFVELARALNVGNGFEPGVDVGPIISERQRDTVVELVETLRATGAELLIGGSARPGPGFFFEPTVFRVTGRPAELCSRELFAPVATIYQVESTADAVAFANDTRYGLAAYVFTKNLSRAVAVGERLDFGMVGINRGIMADPAAAFGGVKASGLGREAGTTPSTTISRPNTSPSPSTRKKACHDRHHRLAVAHRQPAGPGVAPPTGHGAVRAGPAPADRSRRQ